MISFIDFPGIERETTNNLWSSLLPRLLGRGGEEEKSNNRVL